MARGYGCGYCCFGELFAVVLYCLVLIYWLDWWVACSVCLGLVRTGLRSDWWLICLCRLLSFVVWVVLNVYACCLICW